MRPLVRLIATCALLAAIAPAPARAQDDPYADDSPAPAPSASVSSKASEPPERPAPSPRAAESPRAPARPAAPRGASDNWGARAGSGAIAGPAASPRVRYTLENIEILGNARTASRVILRYVPFRAGDALDVDDPEIELTRYRLLGTGFFASVRLALRKGSQRGHAILVIEVVERNTFVVQNLHIGIAADEDTAGNAKPLSPYLGVQAAETNLAGTGITLGAGVALAADQLALRTRFFDPAFVGTQWSASASLLYTDARDFFGSREVAFEAPRLAQREVTDYAVVAYKRFGGTIGTGHDLTVAWQFQLDYRLEAIDAIVPTVASHLRGDRREPIDFDVLPGRSVLSTLRAALVYDTRDAPFLTKRGTLATAALTAGLPPLGSDYAYARLELGVDRWWRLPFRHVVRLEALAGAIAGEAPFYEKFYVGDFTELLPDRVLELAPDRRQPPNYFDTSIIEVRYGDFAGRLQGEYRIPVYLGRGAVYGVDVFASAGIVGVATLRSFTDAPAGYEGFSRVPLDLTFNLGLRVDTSLGGVSIGFANLIGLIPARHGARK